MLPYDLTLDGVVLGGRYLIEGAYTLHSMESAKLGLSVTAPSPADSPGATSPVYPEQVTGVARGTGRFSLRETMRYAGSFHVSFNPIGGGESRGTIYFREDNASEGGDRDGVVSFNGKNVTDDQLFGLLKESQSNDKNVFVLIKADETTPLKKLTFVMDSCRKTGLNKFSLQSR